MSRGPAPPAATHSTNPHVTGMADYDYEEGGFMALYFVLTFLTIILIPLTSSYLVPSFSMRPRQLFIFISDTDFAKGRNRPYAANAPSASRDEGLYASSRLRTAVSVQC